jgi:hypothetical protein
MPTMEHARLRERSSVVNFNVVLPMAWAGPVLRRKAASPYVNHGCLLGAKFMNI